MEKIDDKMMVRYLLGELPEEEQSRLEERYFSDDDCFEQLVAVEDDLIDDYVRGQLSARQRKLFEKNFLTTPQRRQRLEFAKSLLTIVAEAGKAAQEVEIPVHAEARPWWQSLWDFLLTPRPAISFAILLIGGLVGGSFLFFETQHLKTQFTQFNAEQSQLLQRERELRQQLAQTQDQYTQLSNQFRQEQEQRMQLEHQLTRRQEPEPVLVSFVLQSGQERDLEKGPSKLIIPSDINTVQLHLDLSTGEEYKSFRAALRTADGNEIWSQAMLKARPSDSGRAIDLNLPALIFSSDDYILQLLGVTASGDFESAGTYVFRVEKK